MDAEEPVDDTRQAAWKLFDGADGVVAVAAALAAEVKSLRAELDQLNSEPYRKAVIDRMREQKTEVERLRAIVGRIRDLHQNCDKCRDFYRCPLRRALDGSDK
jgi:hypothetical protein